MGPPIARISEGERVAISRAPKGGQDRFLPVFALGFASAVLLMRVAEKVLEWLA